MISRLSQDPPVSPKLILSDRNLGLPHIESPILTPYLFRGLTIFVNMEDKSQRELVQHTLRITGSSITDDPTCQADLIVTDRSRKLAAAVIQKPTPVVQTTQIPWAFMKPRIPLQNPDRKLVVVADAWGKGKPMFKEMSDEVKLYLEPQTGKPSHLSPFQDPSAEREKMRNVGMPADDGFCEICETNYHGAVEHRQSAEHLRRTNDPATFANFDLVAAQLAMDLL
jgi:hypothetical protein